MNKCRNGIRALLVIKAIKTINKINLWLFNKSIFQLSCINIIPIDINNLISSIIYKLFYLI